MAKTDNGFLRQIEEDIAFFRESHPCNKDLKKNEWAFNYWVLEKLFGEDEDEIENKIVEYSDNGVDCFVWHEDTKDLYLIQNKYYGDSSRLSTSYVKKTLQDAYGQLRNGTYDRSNELQGIFSKYSGDDDFWSYHYFYVTNNQKSKDVDKVVRDFNRDRRPEQHRFSTSKT